MELNEWGRIAAKQWEWLQERYDDIVIDEYCVMPNHFHGILAIVGNGRDRSLQPKIKPLPELIGAFKTTSSKLIRRAGLADFQWQKSYYDHVIRDDKSLDQIRAYIRTNPSQWETDPENRLAGAIPK